MSLFVVKMSSSLTGVCGLLLFVSGLMEGGADMGAAQEESLVKKLSAVCGKDGIKVNVRFRHPFRGIVYSDGHYDTPHCVFVDQERNATMSSFPATRFSFLIPADECGTKFHDPGSALSSQMDMNGTFLQPANELANEVYMENTVMFQQNHLIQEHGDLAQTLRCVWQKEIRRPLQATLPLTFRAKHTSTTLTEKNTKDKGKQQQNDIIFATSTPRSTTPLPAFPSKYFSKEFSYLTSSQQRHADIRRKFFQPKGQVESVTYFGRRTGKSLNFNSDPLNRQPRHHHQSNYNNNNNNNNKDVSSAPSVLYRDPSNFTALPFKADIHSVDINHKRSGATAVYTTPLVFLLLIMSPPYIQATLLSK